MDHGFTFLNLAEDPDVGPKHVASIQVHLEVSRSEPVIKAKWAPKVVVRETNPEVLRPENNVRELDSHPDLVSLVRRVLIKFKLL